MKRLLCLLLTICMLLNVAACNTAGSGEQEKENDTAETQTRIFTDSCGREVELPETITSYVPSGPLAQIILFAIAPEEMSGLAAKWYDSAEGIVDDKYLNLPYFGQLYGSADLNVEELANVGPEVLIDMGEVKDSLKENLDILRDQTNIPTVFVESNMEMMPETFRMLGELLGKKEKAEELAAFCEKVYDRTLSIMEKVGDNKVKGIFVVGETGTNVLAHSSYQAETFDMLVDNIAVVENPLSKGTGNEVTMEQIALWNPDFVLFGPQSVYFKAADDPAWSQITAVMNSNYIEVPEGPHNWMGSPPAVQQYLGLIWLTAQLYPEYCDYDVKEEILEYYRLFYSSELTDAQYDALTENAFVK